MTWPGLETIVSATIACPSEPADIGRMKRQYVRAGQGDGEAQPPKGPFLARRTITRASPPGNGATSSTRRVTSSLPQESVTWLRSRIPKSVSGQGAISRSGSPDV